MVTLHLSRRSSVIVPVLVLLALSGCGSAGNAAAAASAASRVGAALSAEASAVHPPTFSSTSTTVTTTTAAPGAALAATTVLMKDDPKLGKLLTDPAGRTLYWFTKDKPGVSNCSGGCLAIWPPFTSSGALTLPAGVPGKLSTITGSNGSAQVSYDGMPLYYYSKDTQPGDTAGEGVLKTWFVVPPTAGPLTPPAA